AGNAPVFHRNELPKSSVGGLELQNVLVGMRDVEVAADQFGGEIGVNAAWVELGHEVLQLGTFGFQLCNAMLTLLETRHVLTPRKDTVRSRQSERGQDQQDAKRTEARQLFLHNIALAGPCVHGSTESQLTPRFKQFRQFAAVIRKGDATRTTCLHEPSSYIGNYGRSIRESTGPGGLRVPRVQRPQARHPRGGL